MSASAKCVFSHQDLFGIKMILSFMRGLRSQILVFENDLIFGKNKWNKSQDKMVNAY